ncbi:MAG TPA: glycosyltransferase [Rhodocyclaceae bacterium]|nr:glycosyltransferase [Rhodocyclaceae bacterium]HRQ45339.1 glycosyltransferase [Rhodocyclaceae bacterium]
MTDTGEVLLSISGEPVADSRLTNVFDPSTCSPGRWIRHGIPYADRSVAGILSQHFVEHLDQTELLIFLRECRRILIPGGTLRIVTIDLRALVNLYTGNGWRGVCRNDARIRWVRTGAEYLNVAMRQSGHSWICDREELCRLGDLAGLQTVSSPSEPFIEPISSQESSDEAPEALTVELRKRVVVRTADPQVSIVIPAYRAEFLQASLDSAIGQTHRNIEIVVTDDSNTTDIETIVRACEGRGIPMIYARNEHSLGEARNLTKAIHMASGEFIKPLYDDDLLAPDCIERLLSALLETPDASMAAGRRLPIDEHGSLLDDTILGPPLSSRSTCLRGAAVIAEIAESRINRLGEPTVMLFRRSDLLALSEPDIMSLFGRRLAGIGDVGLALQMLSRGDLAFVAEPVAFFRLHPNQNQRRPGVREWVIKSWQYFGEQAARLGLTRADETAPAFEPTRSPGSGLAVPIEPLGESQVSSYHLWMSNRRQALATATEVLGAPFEARAPSVHLLVRLAEEDAARFLETIDNLKFQHYNQWLLDVVTTLPAPEGIADIDCIGWHAVPADKFKEAVDTLVTHRELDWIVELPAGAVLDPLCLWRVACDAVADEGAAAFFVDDDIYDESGSRANPRFKPGVNPAWLRSSDLAGPLFVRRDAWIDSGGAATRNGSPWFDQLLRLTRRTGWSGIRHIADVLVSYPRTAPGDLRSCLASVLEDLQAAGARHEVLPLTDRSWSLRPALDDAPRVTIAVLSQGQTDLLGRCLASIVERTAYANYDLLIAATDCGYDPQLHDWLEGIEARYGRPVRVATTPPGANQAARCNAAVAACDSELIVFVREECIIVQAQWLEELVRASLDDSVAAVAPRLIDPRDKTIIEAGRVLGLDGPVGTPYRNGAGLEDAGMLDQLKVTRDASILSATCMLVRTVDYRAVGGMDPEGLDDGLSDADLCLRLRAGQCRLLVQPLASVVYRGDSTLSIPGDAEADVRRLLMEARSCQTFAERWLRPGARDPFWNPNLSLARTTPTEETAGRIQWHFQPVTTVPRILARPLPNAQGHYRIESPLACACEAGIARGGIWPQADDDRELSVGDLSRLAPTSLIVQNYLLDRRLQTLQTWRAHPHRPFTVYALDDLITDLDESNPGRRRLAANARARLQRALAHCDRLVVSTDTLAEVYRHFIDDVRVVPNRLDDRIWLPLQAQRHTTSRPRIGWAGGSAHERDLMLLKPVIERTRNEADWVFFGMCPEELRPLIAEYHEFGTLIDYPERLAALNLDLAVAPLADTPFNHAKSNLRLLECGALGIPVVCSDVTPYRDSPACRVPNHADRWTEALRARIHDADARDGEGRALGQWVRENYLLVDHLEEWLNAHLPA